jgi:RHS repeat-associated protein
VSYHHPDRLGTRVVSNNQNTTSFEQVTLPFGTALNSESTGSTNRRFTSYDRSTATSLDYALNRFYDPQQGRFTQVDPMAMGAVQLEDPQTLNLYAYCVNDPVNHVDPDGLGFFSFFKKLFKAILKVLANKWVSIAIGVALAVISFGTSMGWWSLLTKVTKVVNIGMDLGWGVQTATTTVTQLTLLGKIAIGLTIAATIPSLTSVKGILSMVAGYALGRVVGALGLVTAGATRRGGTPEWNPNANGFQYLGSRRQRTFATMDEAAAAALRRINRRSRQQNAEYAGRLCERNGRFGYTRARRLPGAQAEYGSDPDQSPCPTGWNTVASYHTHGANLTNYENERFSNELQWDGSYAGDIPFSNAENRPVYLATPHRLMMVYDPAVGSTIDYTRATRHLPGVTP